jgi:hypothetical protein
LIFFKDEEDPEEMPSEEEGMDFKKNTKTGTYL